MVCKQLDQCELQWTRYGISAINAGPGQERGARNLNNNNKQPAHICEREYRFSAHLPPRNAHTHAHSHNVITNQHRRNDEKMILTQSERTRKKNSSNFSLRELQRSLSS
jgi:hypothetical protein